MTVEDGEGIVKNARWEIELEKNIFEGDNPITVTTNQTYAPGFFRKFGMTATIGTCRATGVMETSVEPISTGNGSEPISL